MERGMDYDINIGNDIDIEVDVDKESLPDKSIEVKSDEEPIITKDINIGDEVEESKETPESEIIEETDDSKKSKELLALESKYKNNLAKLRRQKNEMAKENKKLKEEYLKTVEYSYQADVASVNGELGNVESQLAMAQEELKKAVIDGDVESHVQSNVKIADLTAKKRELLNYRYQQQQYKPNVEAQQRAQAEAQQQEAADAVYDPEEDDNEYRADWVKRNRWADQRSINFNPQMAEEISYVAGQLTSELQRLGRQDLIWGEYYFNKLDDYVKDKFYKVKPGQTQKKQSSSGGIAPVGGSARNARLQLSKEQKEMAAAYGVTEDEFKDNWRKSLEAQEKEMNIRNRERS